MNLSEWKAVEENLPEDARDVLVFLDDGSMELDYYIPHRHKWGWLREQKITHWMPAPEPPK